ncbi:hypothetical protein [Variovorax sp. EBFNA2]|uniref:hypothetical protein n=1 Tax=Variovorax sp. EBFNA2 TaxID=3342097 RepID=UPI0029C02489|nr:hypothetical protein [Variovorax boronicumulans]WPG35332.1 hypothetical protein RZE79_17755 [Variovorax boronicumulans]
MSTIDHDQEPAFARGIAGPLGKLTEDLKTKVDETTHKIFLQHCAASDTDTSTLLRDFVYMCSYGKTWRQMVAERLIHDGERTDAMRKLTGPFEGPEFGAKGARAC